MATGLVPVNGVTLVSSIWYILHWAPVLDAGECCTSPYRNLYCDDYCCQPQSSWYGDNMYCCDVEFFRVESLKYVQKDCVRQMQQYEIALIVSGVLASVSMISALGFYYRHRKQLSRNTSLATDAVVMFQAHRHARILFSPETGNSRNNDTRNQ